MKYANDCRVVLTLDAGGTNFVFSAIQGCKVAVEQVRLPAFAGDLDKCLETICKGFKQTKEQASEEPVAISFAFPGPADYPNGIIGDLANLPAFRGGVALGPLLEAEFGVPVFINNDGDLFAYGEAIAGLLPMINKKLAAEGNPKRFKNLLGVTLGTGFSGGIVRDGELFIGDNAAAGEIWCSRNKLYPTQTVEESISIRGVRRVYAREAGIPFDDAPTPKRIYQIAQGDEDGNQAAAIESFREFGEVLGDTLVNAITLVDGLIVIGGGLAGAQEFFMPALIQEMNSTINEPPACRMELKAFNLEDDGELDAFLKGETKEITVSGTEKTVTFDSLKRVGVGVAVLDTSQATSIGAYAFALNKLDG